VLDDLGLGQRGERQSREESGSDHGEWSMRVREGEMDVGKKEEKRPKLIMPRFKGLRES
jgi:hypothetical protein